VNKWLRLLVSAGLLAWLGWRLNWLQVAEAFRHLRVGFWLAAVGVYAAAQVASAFRWRLLARPLGLCQPVGRFAVYYFVGMFFNLFLPTSVGGDVVRAWYLDGGSGHRLFAFLSVLVDRLSGLAVLLLLACTAVLLCPVALPRWIPWSVWLTIACGAGGLLTATLAARWTDRGTRLGRLFEGIKRYLYQPGLLAQATALSLVVQGANIILVWLVGLSIQAPVPASYYWIAVPMVTLLTLLPVSLNGIGVREGGMILFLSPLGVSEATALSLAFLWFTVFTTVSAAGAVVYLFGSFPRLQEPGHGPLGCDPDQGRARQLKAAA
jgi:glycosyltransferase 2 family protein